MLLLSFSLKLEKYQSCRKQQSELLLNKTSAETLMAFYDKKNSWVQCEYNHGMKKDKRIAKPLL